MRSVTLSVRSGGRGTASTHWPSGVISGAPCTVSGARTSRRLLPPSMPTYDYQCQKGHRFEVFQRMSDDPVAECPECGEAAQRMISGGAGFLFKGDGFYITDYRSDDYKKKASAEKPGSDSGSSSASSSESSSSSSASSSSSSTASGSSPSSDS